MRPTQFVPPLLVSTEPYEDRQARIIKHLRALGEFETIAFIHEQSRMLVRVEAERDDLLPDAVEPADVHADDKAVAFITQVSNGWKH